MRIHVKLFAIIRERAGVGEIQLDLSNNATISDAVRSLGENRPTIADLLNRAAFAVNQSVVDAKTMLKDGDELAILPPVSGG